MTAIITHPFRYQNLRETKRRIDAGKDLYYLAIGRSEPWTSDLSPPEPEVDPTSEMRARHSIQSMKKIVDVAFCAPRYNWVNGQTYVAYDAADPDLHTKAFYALNTTTFNVYLCLKAGSGASTVEPTGVNDEPAYGGTTGVSGSATPQQLADGYIWKYLYTIDAGSANKFLTTDFMPVLRDAEVASEAIFGQIWTIDILSGGSGYGSAPTVSIVGDGTGAAATATVAGGVVTAINITNPGSGYSYARVNFSGGSPVTAATARANPSTIAIGRELEGVTVSAGGSGYTNGSTSLVIDGDGYNAEITATVSGGVVQAGPTVDEPGYGYSQATLSVDLAAGSGAVLVPQFSEPKGGFGYDPVTDLRAFYLMFNVILDGAEGSGDFIPANDYRQLLIIKNPLNMDSPADPFTATTGFAMKYLTVDSGGTWALDDLITGGSSGAKAYIDYYDADLLRVYYHQTEETGWLAFTDGETLTGSGVSTGAIDAASGSADGEPEIDRYSGVVQYLENRAPVSRATDQTEDIKLVIQF